MRFSTMAARLLQRIASPSSGLRLVRQQQRWFWASSLPGPFASTGYLIKRVPRQMEQQFPLPLGSAFQRFGYSSASPKPAEDATPESDAQSDDSQNKAQDEETDLSDLSFDDLAKLVAEKEEVLKVKQKEFEAMQDKVLRTYAEMENVMVRTKRESENSKKFAIQSFAKSLLDVADNLGRASSVVKESFSKIDQSEDTSGAVPLLKTLLEGVEMTDKQLSEVFKKFGVEKYDPIDEEFDPNRHYAVFQIPDASKAANTVAAVLKPGYVLHDRIIRPAEVGVVVSPQ